MARKVLSPLLPSSFDAFPTLILDFLSGNRGARHHHDHYIKITHHHLYIVITHLMTTKTTIAYQNLHERHVVIAKKSEKKGKEKRN